MDSFSENGVINESGRTGGDALGEPFDFSFFLLSVGTWPIKSAAMVFGSGTLFNKNNIVANIFYCRY